MRNAELSLHWHIINVSVNYRNLFSFVSERVDSVLLIDYIGIVE